MSSLMTPVPKSHKTIDIPRYETPENVKNLPFVYWHFSKQKENQLALKSPEKSVDSLIYRIWITNPVGKKGQPHGLIEIIRDSISWTGKLILMKVDLNAKRLAEKITTKRIIELKPLRSNWEAISDSLTQLKFSELPTDEKIPGYYVENEQYGNYEPTYSFEYATKSEYRFYQYNNIDRVPDKFWQPAHVIRILNLMEAEFNYDSIGREYFK